MSRHLKDPVPCVDCKEPVEVRCRADIPYARCPRCRETKRLENCAGYAMKHCNDLLRKDGRTLTESAGALGHAAIAIHHCMRAAEQNAKKAHGWRLRRIAVAWLDWVSRASATLKPALEQARDESLPVEVIVNLEPVPQDACKPTTKIKFAVVRGGQ